MKSNIKILIVCTVILIPGCEYDGPTAMWKQPYNESTAASISTILPTEADGGVNYITIQGDHFSELQGKNSVYIDGYMAEVTSSTINSITIRRPDRYGDSTIVKVVNNDAFQFAVFTPYKITRVHAPYGNFIDGSELSAVTVDENENVYVIQRNPRNVYKIDAQGAKSTLGTASRTVTDAAIRPDGKLVLFMNNKSIMQMDCTTGEETEFVQLSKKVSFGEFNDDGILYTGGDKSDLIALKTDMTEKPAGVYSKDAILCIRLFGGYVYCLIETARPDSANPALAIWRHAILDNLGSLGEKQLVADWSAMKVKETAVPTCFAVSQEGIYLGSDDTRPILIIDPDTDVWDILYKDILEGSAENLVFGNGQFLYMIKGGDSWDLIRIDAG